MESILEIIGQSKIYNGNIHIPSDIKKRFGFRDGEKIIWAISKQGQLVISKAEIGSIY